MPVSLKVTVHTLRHEADNIISVELRAAHRGALPTFDAGAHIDLHLPNGLVRQYSLLNAIDDKRRYVIAVLLDRASRGGSRSVHRDFRIGMELTISAPRNHFKLRDEARHTVLVCGGIGVTPILAMARSLKANGRSFELMYLARTRSSAAFAHDLEAMGMPAHWHFDDERGGPPDLTKLLGNRPPDAHTHYYACGPAVMLDSFLSACRHHGHAHAHIERFNAVASEAASDAQLIYTVTLKRSGKTFTVTPEKTLLNTLLDSGIHVAFSCGEGICGTCETKVLAGIPDHRDAVLSEEERASNASMMVCVSGCKSGTLVLDI